MKGVQTRLRYTQVEDAIETTSGSISLLVISCKEMVDAGMISRAMSGRGEQL